MRQTFTAMNMLQSGGLLGQIESKQWVITFTLILVCIFLLELWRRNRNLPPGPWGLPLVGYYPFLGSRPYIKLNDLSFKYGDVTSFRTLGGYLVVFLNRLPVVKEVFVTRADEFIGRPLETNLVSWVDDGLGISQTEGVVWKEQRRFFLQSTKIFGFGKMECEPLIHELVQSAIDDIKLLNAKSFEPSIHVSHVTANVISSILFQKRFAKDSPTFLNLFHGFKDLVGFFLDSRVLIVGSVFDHVLLKMLPSGRNAEKSRHVLLSLAKEIVEEHVNTFDESNPRNYVDSYLAHMKRLSEKGELGDSSFSLDRLIAITFNMLLEGTQSVGATVCGSLLELSRHADAQKKAQEELDSVVGRNRLPSWADRQNLPYLEALIQELYRTNQPFFTSTFYSNFEETTIRNYRIPKRSLIMANFWSINNDPTQFPEPSKFDPSRFLMADGNRSKQEGPVPFGIGKRACVGESLAQMEVFIFLASMLQSFTLYPAVLRKGWIKAIPRDTT